MEIQNLEKIMEIWTNERKELLVIFNELCNLENHIPNENEKKWLEEDLKEFCQLLVDYLSKGQFEIFEKIIAKIEKEAPYKNSVNKIIANKLLFTTFKALDFNDKHADKPNFPTLKKDLSELGEALAQRLELEDTLIDSFYQTTNQETA